MTNSASTLIICRLIMSEYILSQEEVEELREVIRLVQLNLVINFDSTKHMKVTDRICQSKEDEEDSRDVDTLSDKLKKADDKNQRLLEMYSAKVREVSELEEKLRMSEAERETLKDKLRMVELEVRFSRQCHGENALLNSLMSRLDIRPGQGLLGPGPSPPSHPLPVKTPPFVPRSVMKNPEKTKL